VLDVAGVAPHPDFPLDGMSVSSTLRDPASHFDRPLFWRMKHRDQRAFRQGDWKYLQVDGNDYLFNITEDARERANRAKVEPARLDAMKQSWSAWNDSMPAIPADAEVKLGYSNKDMPQR